MTQVFLHRFDVITAFDRHNSIGVSEVMKTGSRRANLVHDPLEAIIDGAVGKKTSGLVGKNQVVFFLKITGLQTQPILL